MNGKIQRIGEIDRALYSCVSRDILTTEVIITGERIQHITLRHPGDYEKYHHLMPDILRAPDYILQANRQDTAVLLKGYCEKGQQFQLVLKLATSGRGDGRKNSVITFLKISDRTWKKYLRNKVILYKREEM